MPKETPVYDKHTHDYGPVVAFEEKDDGTLKEVKSQACRICGAKKKAT